MNRPLTSALALVPLLTACGQPPPAPEAATSPERDSKPQQSQVSYAQVLQMQGVTFNVISANTAAENTVTVSTAGLEIDNSAWSQPVDGIVTGAEVADLNADGSPEVYVYVQSNDAEQKGSVLGYVANNRKSLSTAFMPPLSDTPEAADGYRGRDEFAVLEGVLGRRFPIYGEGGTPTGKTRQLQYKLSAGEAGWLLTLDRTTEF